MRAVCAKLNAGLAKLNGETGHVHVLVAYPPTLAISVLTQHLKGRTAYTVRREYTGACLRVRMRGHPESPSYFAVSCAGSPAGATQEQPATPMLTRQHPLRHNAFRAKLLKQI
jgi:putative transposase